MSSASEPPYPYGGYSQPRSVPPGQTPAGTARALPAAPPGAGDDEAGVETIRRTALPGAGGPGGFPPPGGHPGVTGGYPGAGAAAGGYPGPANGPGGYPGGTSAPGGYPGNGGGLGGYPGAPGGPGGYPGAAGGTGGYREAGDWFNPTPAVQPGGQVQGWQDPAGQGGRGPANGSYQDGYPGSSGGYPGSSGGYPGSGGGYAGGDGPYPGGGGAGSPGAGMPGGFAGGAGYAGQQAAGPGGGTGFGPAEGTSARPTWGSDSYRGQQPASRYPGQPPAGLAGPSAPGPGPVAGPMAGTSYAGQGYAPAPGPGVGPGPRPGPRPAPLALPAAPQSGPPQQPVPGPVRQPAEDPLGGYPRDGFTSPGGAHRPQGGGYQGNGAYDPRDPGGGYAPGQQPGFMTGQQGTSGQQGTFSQQGTSGQQGTSSQQGTFGQQGWSGSGQDELAARPGAPTGGPYPGAGQPSGFLSPPPGSSLGTPQPPQDQYPPYREGAYSDSAQFSRDAQFPPGSSAPRFPDAPQQRGGAQFAGGAPRGPKSPDEAQFPDERESPQRPQFANGSRFASEPQFPNGSQFPNRQQFPNGPQFPDGPGGFPDGPSAQGDYARPGAPGGYAGPAAPGGPAGPGAPAGPSGPARPGGSRRRITDAFARLGSFTPGAGFAAARHSREPANWDDDAPFRSAEDPGPWAPEAAGRPAPGNAAASPNKNRNLALVVGAGVLSVAAVAGVILAPKVFGPSDPGCKAYAGPALTAYDKTINDLNGQASQSLLSTDMSAAVSELTQAAAAARGSAVRSALNGLLSELKTVQAEVASGAVPTSTVNALNAASTTADKAC